MTMLDTPKAFSARVGLTTRIERKTPRVTSLMVCLDTINHYGSNLVLDATAKTRIENAVRGLKTLV